MMKIVSLQFLMLSAFVLTLAGCSPAKEASNSISDADQSAIEAYEQALAEEESAMDEAPPEEGDQE
ncbi:MAG: hypothetical protein ISQ09_13205 [Rubripirellula sp.]|jgi:uncharacterized lipoprotein|nr:hypothetical protein [Rubripirellula sp.]